MMDLLPPLDYPCPIMPNRYEQHHMRHGNNSYEKRYYPPIEPFEYMHEVSSFVNNRYGNPIDLQCNHDGYGDDRIGYFMNVEILL
jgi:hypothetical protein